MNIRSRHDAILRKLRRNITTTISELAADVGASRRTVLRDLAALRAEGFMIHGEAGRGGGVQLDPRSVLASPRLSVAEVFALSISVAAMRAAGTLPIAGLADAGLAKIEKALPPEKLRDLRRFLDCLHIGQVSPRQDLPDMLPMDPDVLPAFETAFLERRCLSFACRDASGCQSMREIEPQAILILPPLWYLVAWDPMRGDFRHFRMDRITRPDVMQSKSFRPRRVPFDKDVCPYRDLIG